MVPWGDDWEIGAAQMSFVAASAGSKVNYDELIKGEGLKKEITSPDFDEVEKMFSLLPMNK